MIGQTCNRLTVVSLAPRRQKNRPRYFCRCVCGNEVDVDHYHLKSGHTQSCGCVKLEISTTRLFKHGLTKTPEHKCWVEMRARCLRTDHHAFEHYGGRGISICDRWSEFLNFLADMGARPTLKHSLDRIDVDGNYEPSNCRWALPVVQQSNRRDTRKIAFEGETLCLTHWGDRFGIDQRHMHYWVVVKGLTLDQVRERYRSRAC